MKYYLHDSNSFNDEKISELFIEYGYEGLGLFYTILEKLASQEKPIKTSVLKHQLKVGKKLEKCWNFMESLGIISSNNGDTFNKQLLNYSEKYQIKKEKNSKRVSEWRENQAVEENVTRTQHVRNSLKVNKSKLKVDKVNTQAEIVCENPVQFFDKTDLVCIIDAEETVLALKILHEFKFNQIHNQDKLRHATACVKYLNSKKKLEYFNEQYPAYFEYKKISGEQMHHFKSFLGSPENQYEDAGWETAVWTEKLKNYKNGKQQDQRGKSNIGAGNRSDGRKDFGEL